MQFDYYYGAEADQFNFIKVPKAMIKDSAFASLSLASRLLYGLLLDRMNLSMKNKWLDEDNRVYIIYQITEIMEDLGVSKKKAIEYLKELEQFGLVEKKRRGLGLPSYLYIKIFISKKEQMNDRVVVYKESNAISDVDRMDYSNEKNIGIKGASSATSRSSHFDTSIGVELDISKSIDMEHQEITVGLPQNNTKQNYIDINNADLILNHNDYRIENRMDETKIYEEYLTEKLEIDLLCERYPQEADIVIGMYDLVMEILLCKRDSVLIAGNELPTQVVKSRFMKLDSSHIEYVLSCMQENTTKIRNIKKYLLAVLFNAPTTMKSFYQAEFNHDMLQYIG